LHIFWNYNGNKEKSFAMLNKQFESSSLVQKL